MNRNINQKKRSAGRGEISTVLFILLLLALILIFVYCQHTPTRPSESVPADLTTTAPSQIDRDLIYAGEPQPLDPTIHIQILHNTGYTVGYSNERKNPLWVAYRLFQVDHPPALPRPQNFEPDDRTSAHITSRDYTNSGFDRGHMAPNHAIATHYGEKAQLETFLMSNITPQLHQINAGIWEEIERDESDRYANRFGTVWVLDGPLFDPQPHTLKSGVQIPRAFYKILVRETNHHPEFLAFIVTQPDHPTPPSDVPRTQPEQCLTTVREIEHESHFNFFWELDQALQDQLETTKASGMW